MIIEPVVGNMGCVPPEEGYLQAVRRVTERSWRAPDLRRSDDRISCRAAALSELYGITPDMTTLGKIIGGGLPVGAYGGSREIMNNIAPAGLIYQAGTVVWKSTLDDRRPGDVAAFAR